MSTHNLYMAKLVTLGTTTLDGFVSLAHSERKTQVSPRGNATIRARKRYTTGIEETLTVECEALPAEALPDGELAFIAEGVRPLIGDAFGAGLRVKTKTGASVVIESVDRDFDQGASNRMRITLAVLSADGVASGLEWEAVAAP